MELGNLGSPAKRLRCPKGYKVTVHQVKNMGPGTWYDCRVWKDGQIVLSTSMTAMENKEKMREMGVQRAIDLNNGATSWT
jgi:hypothetical protein